MSKRGAAASAHATRCSPTASHDAATQEYLSLGTSLFRNLVRDEIASSGTRNPAFPTEEEWTSSRRPFSDPKKIPQTEWRQRKNRKSVAARIGRDKEHGYRHNSGRVFEIRTATD
jgi:hypothetical protein